MFSNIDSGYSARTVNSLSRASISDNNLKDPEVAEKEEKICKQRDRTVCGRWKDLFGRVCRLFSAYCSIAPKADLALSIAPIDVLKNDRSLQEVFKYLSDCEKEEAKSVCRQWKTLIDSSPFAINQPMKSQVTIFGKKAWEKRLGLAIEGEIPPVPENILKIVKSFRERIKEEREAPSCSLILMPKGLSLEMLEKLAKKPHSGKRAEIEDGPEGFVFEFFGKEEILESYWVLITDDVLEGSGGLDYQAQSLLIQEKAGPECQAPFFLEAAVSAIMNHNRYGRRLFGEHSETSTRCQETDWDGDHVIVWSPNSGTLCIDFDQRNEDALGVMVCRRFMKNPG